MGYIEDIQREHREEWFKDHKATLTKHGDLIVIDWKQPGTNYHSIRYVFEGNNIYITGDCGVSTFCLNGLAVPDKVAEYTLSYFIKRLEAYSEEKYVFNSNKAIKEIDAWYQEYLVDKNTEAFETSLKELYKELCTIAENSYDIKEWVHRIWTLYDNWVNSEVYLDSEDIEIFSNFGSQLAPRLIVHHLGLKMAIDQLNKESGY